MCGISGAFSWAASAASPSKADVQRVRDQMWRRGQDGSGFWASASGRAMFGHRRLAIIDLDVRSRQPMSNGPLTLVFNGEIYNYRALRAELQLDGWTFSTEGDSEVILALFRRDGITAFDRLRGMFAIAIFDERDQSLTLARDPYGIKPLYVGTVPGQCWFASQVKALRTVPHLSSDPDPAGLTGFHLWGSVPEPFTLYRSIRSLPAGHWQRIDRHGATDPVQYASVAQALAEATVAREEQVGDVVVAAIRDSVAAHLIADVEAGVFLSGGIDSATILGAMTNLAGPGIKSITIGFEDYRGTQLDEVPVASETARQFGARHIIEWLTRADLDANLESVLSAMDQPSIDGVNSWFASRAAHRAGLKIALSGLGADELLAGYSNFDAVPALHRRARHLARLPFLAVVADWTLRHGLAGFDRKHHKASGVLRLGGTLSGAYFLRRALLVPSRLHGALDDEVARIGLEQLQPIRCVAATLKPEPATDTQRMIVLESCNYMKNQLLRDSDWASMAHTLEVRLPFVDWPTLQRIAPVSRWLGQRRGKRALGNVPAPHLNEELLNRPKSGFAMPLNTRVAASSALESSGSRAWAARVAAAFTPSTRVA